MAKLIIPLAWWLLFPVVTIVCLLAEVLLITKLFYPLWRRVKKRYFPSRAKPKLQLESQRTDDSGFFSNFTGDLRSNEFLTRTLPIVFVCLYTIWPKFTIHFFQVLQSDYFFVGSALSCGSDTPVTKVTWLRDTRLQFLSGRHLTLGLLAILGLMVWSFGLLIGLHLVITQLRQKLQVQHNIRMVGFFFRGLQPRWYWWELFVKRGEILLVYAVVYLPIASDDKAKLLLCATISGFALILQLSTMPHDDRHGMLFDHMEIGGILIRFLTFLGVLGVILFNASESLIGVVAAVLLLLNLSFITMMLLLITSEIAHSLNRTLACQQSGEVSLTMARCASKTASWLARYLAAMCQERSFLEARTQRFHWAGPGKPIAVIEHTSEVPIRGVRMLFHKCLRRFYSLTHSGQCKRAGDSVGQVFEHLLAEGVQFIPNMMLEFACVLPIALRRIDALRSNSFHPVKAVIDEVECVVGEAHDMLRWSRNQGTQATFLSGEHIQRSATAEDMCHGIEHIRQMRPGDLSAVFDAFLAAASQTPPRFPAEPLSPTMSVPPPPTPFDLESEQSFEV
eukprot:NODE_3544_length_2021_cov_5.743928.p1 GENE.NODE_3544_length_2021_cov_5.743928~~NODE_3544_length_2021_cov_5.743928.p1  ORF type:complete len:564 (-),score=78.98 NODE_3544_length_2021_cov_5.743928:41-1732(-)